MDAEDEGAGGEAEEAPGLGGPSDPGSPGGPGGQEGPGRGGAGVAGAQAGEAPQVAAALSAPGPGGDALPGPIAEIPRPEPIDFSFTVPFRSPAEAQVAREYMAEHFQPHAGVVEQDFTVSDHLLTIRLTSEDPFQLIITLATCLEELTMLLRTLRFIFLHLLSNNHKLGKGG